MLRTAGILAFAGARLCPYAGETPTVPPSQAVIDRQSTPRSKAAAAR
jgi:hypothetical protein